MDSLTIMALKHQGVAGFRPLIIIRVGQTVIGIHLAIVDKHLVIRNGTLIYCSWTEQIIASKLVANNDTLQGEIRYTYCHIIVASILQGCRTSLDFHFELCNSKLDRIFHNDRLGTSRHYIIDRILIFEIIIIQHVIPSIFILVELGKIDFIL